MAAQKEYEDHLKTFGFEIIEENSDPTFTAWSLDDWNFSFEVHRHDIWRLVIQVQENVYLRTGGSGMADFVAAVSWALSTDRGLTRH